MSPPKWASLWSRECFKILPFAMMKRVERVCQKQLSYLSKYIQRINVECFLADCNSNNCMHSVICHVHVYMLTTISLTINAKFLYIHIHTGFYDIYFPGEYGLACWFSSFTFCKTNPLSIILTG